MRFIIIGTLSLLACSTCAGLATATGAIDHPSPPPYCADGLCYPKAESWGHYQGRWRRWPGDVPAPLPSTIEPTPAEQIGPDIHSFEAPPPTEEDRRAAPPRGPVAPPAAPPAAMPEELDTPAESPAERDAPLPELPWESEPTGDWDPPPPLPFRTPGMDTAPAVRTSSRPSGPQLHSPSGLPRTSAAVDSPPALPLALGRPRG